MVSGSVSPGPRPGSLTGGEEDPGQPCLLPGGVPAPQASPAAAVRGAAAQVGAGKPGEQRKWAMLLDI